MGTLSWTWAGGAGGCLNICIDILVYIHAFLYVVGGTSLVLVSFRELLLIFSE